MNEISQKSHGKELVCNLLLPGSLVCCSAESGSTICCSLAPSVVRCSLYYRDVNSTWGGQSESSLTSGISGSSGSVPWFRLRTLLACASQVPAFQQSLSVERPWIVQTWVHIQRLANG